MVWECIWTVKTGRVIVYANVCVREKQCVCMRGLWKGNEFLRRVLPACDYRRNTAVVCIGLRALPQQGWSCASFSCGLSLHTPNVYNTEIPFYQLEYNASGGRGTTNDKLSCATSKTGSERLSPATHLFCTRCTYARINNADWERFLHRDGLRACPRIEFYTFRRFKLFIEAESSKHFLIASIITNNFNSIVWKLCNCTINLLLNVVRKW